MKYKFRGQNIFSKDWHYGSLLETESNAYILTDGEQIQVKPETVGQMTLLNGVEIYEGDVIVSVFDNEPVGGIVAFTDGTFVLEDLEQISPSYKSYVSLWDDGSYDHYSLEMLDGCEINVIKNIHQ